MNFINCRFFKMPSYNQEINVDLNSNENGALKTDAKDGKIDESRYMSAEPIPNNAPAGLNADQEIAFALRDFLTPSSTALSDGEPSPSALSQTLPFIDEQVDGDDATHSEEELQQSRETEEVLNNAACRLRRWRAASRKLRRPRIINNLSSKDEKDSNISKVCNSGHTDLADRLRSLAAAGSMSASAGELLSLAPPPPAATAPPSPGCLLSPSLADQSSAEYFGSSPECCADNAGLDSANNAGTPAPPPGPRYKLASEGSLRVCCFQHTRTVVDKILAAKFLRRWETHVLCLNEQHITSKTPSGLLEHPLSYSCMQEVYCISRWDPARKYCLRIVMPHGSLLLQANDAYTRDQWYHSIIWRRNMIRYKNFLTKTVRKEVVLKELKNMVDFVMTTPLQDESVTRAPLQILTDLLSENKESEDWEEWAEMVTSAAAPLLAERCAAGDLCALLARLCRRRPRAAPLPALAPPVRRVLTRNVDFARAPNGRRLVRDYISALSAHNSGSSLVRRFVEVTHGNRATCPYPRAAPNLAAVALAALDDHYRDSATPHVCDESEEEVLCFADILEHMCEYEDWLVVVGAVLQPVPLCAGAMSCPRVAKRLGKLLNALAHDPRCAAHACVAPARAARLCPPSWLRAAAPSDPLLALPNEELCQIWGDMLGGLLNCCCKRKSFLQSMSKQLPDFVLVALTAHDNTTVIVENGEEIIKVNTMQVPNGISHGKHLNGPDQVIPADSFICSVPGGHVKLHVQARGVASEPPISVPGLLNRTVARYPDATALATKKADGKWHKITYKQYQERVRTVAKAFIKLGLERYHSVCILGFNSEQWFVADLAAIHAGGYAAGIYTTNSADACYHCLLSSRANICAVQDKKQLDKILSVRHKLPHLKALIQWEGNVDTSVPGVYSWDQVLEMGAKEPNTQLDNVLKTIAVNECCTLVYTSGTVGPPKAVMLSHDNLTWDAYSITERVGDLQPTYDRIISFLPLSHVAAQVVDIYTTLSNAIPVFFAQPDALKGSLVETLKEVRPTRFLGVPRVWEKMYEKIMAVGASSGYFKKQIAMCAKEKGLKYHLARINGVDGSAFGYKMAKSLVFNKIHESLGLDHCTTFVTSAAPLSPDIKKFFLSLDLPIVDAFGMSEASGAHTLSIYPKFSLDSAGALLDGTETMFGGATSPNGPGEIMMRGRHVFMGYLNDEAKTKEAIDEEGWLHSGDIGRVDSNGLLYITGRIKELLITAGGENVAPVLIEQAVQAELLHIGYAVLIGDRRKFLSILVTLKAKVNSETSEALDDLDNETRKWVASLGSKATKISEIVNTKDPAVHKAIEEGIARANKHAISNAQKIQKFAILPADFSVHSGELGPTLKVKRNVVYEKYKDIIEDFYKE